MVQVWMHIKDLQPTEKTNADTYKKGGQLHYEGWTREKITKSIAGRGYPLYALNVNCKGEIENGNERYWVCRELFEAGDKRFEFLPVNISTVAGLKLLPTAIAPTTKATVKGSSHLDNPHNKTIPPNNTFKELPDGFDPAGESNPCKTKQWLLPQQVHSHKIFIDDRLITR